MTRERITLLESELSHKEISHATKLAKVNADADIRIQTYESQLKDSKEHELDLVNRISELTCKENELLEKAHTSEIEFSEKISSLTMQLEKLKVEAEQREKELEAELIASKGEVKMLRRAQRMSPDKSPGASSKPGSTPASRALMLEDEVESLRCVLDLKQTEISDLRKHNQELQRVADEHNALTLKHSALESRVEDLQVQLQCKLAQET